MIVGTENLRDMFSIFHDGVIIRYEPVASNLDLDVEILYLAQRVNPEYRGFRVVLQNAREFSFTTWPNDQTAPPAKMESLPDIFAPKLDILGCDIENGALKVICNQSSPQWNYCGGELCLKADSATVTDPGGEEYSIEQLGRLSDEYWNEWQGNAGNSPTAQPAAPGDAREAVLLVVPPPSASGRP
jgi:hypothetical protein